MIDITEQISTASTFSLGAGDRIGKMTFADEIQALGKHQGVLHVRLSNQLIYLLSEQMYSSPIKAIEELVVNAYDADATTCRIGFVDKVKGSDSAIVIYDDGSGMDYAGLEQLWHVGESPKVVQDTTPRRNRKGYRKVWYRKARNVRYRK